MVVKLGVYSLVTLWWNGRRSRRNSEYMSMRFSDAQLQDALVKWRALKDVKERSAADNIWFEQRVSMARQNTFEQEAAGAADPTSLRRAHADYWSARG